MAHSKHDIVTIGDCSIDYFVVPTGYQISRSTGSQLLSFPLGRKLPTEKFMQFPGGNALNTAVSFARLGLRTAIITELGKDVGANLVFERIKRERIDGQYVRTSAKTETNNSIVLVTAGERTILSHHSPKTYPLPKNLSSEWAYLTSMGDGFETVYRYFSARTKSRVKVSFNPGSQQLLQHRKAVRELLRHTKLLFVNMEEGRTLLGGNTASPRQLLYGLKRLGAETVFVTDGKQGAYAIDETGSYKIGIYAAKRVDATGAGDAFASGATAAIAQGNSIKEAMRWGSINAAKEVAEIGVQNGLCTKTELLSLLKKYPIFKASWF